MLSVAYMSVDVGFEFRYESSCPSGSTRAIYSGRRSRGMPIYGFYASSQSQTELAKSGQNPPTRTSLYSGYANNPLNIDDSSAVVGYGDSATITT